MHFLPRGQLFVGERARQQAEIHDARRFCETQAVGCGQSFVAVGALHEFVAKAGTPLRSVGGRLRDCFQAETASVFAADFDGESVIEPKSLARVRD